MAASCCKDDPESIPKGPFLEGDSLEQTIIIYMAGENSLANYVARDSSEFSLGLPAISPQTRVVVYIDDTHSSRLCVGTSTKTLQTVRTYDGNVCSTDSAEMSRILSDITTTYPARHYGLVMWSHASGWLFQPTAKRGPHRSFGIDNGQRTNSNTGPQMNIPVLAQVLKQGPHFDFIFFDACFMQCVEVAYELRHVTDYILGSPAEIPGDGAPYHLIMPYLTQQPADLAGAMYAYADFYVSGAGARTYHGAILSVIQTDQLEALAAATQPIVRQLLDGHAYPNCSAVQRYCRSERTTDYTDFYDFQNLVYVMQPELYDDWMQAFDAAVPCSAITNLWYSALPYGHVEQVSDVAHCGGVSMFVPKESFEEMGWTDDYRQLQWYKASGMNLTGW